MSTEQGLVIDTNADIATIKTLRSAACKSCDHKKNCGSAPGNENEMHVKVKNRLGVKIGDTVIITIKTTSLLKVAFLLYIFPILCMILGAVMGRKLAPSFILDESLASVLSGAIFFGASFFLIRRKGKKMAFKEEYAPAILRIKKRGV
ncbi:MAG: SoxR reducing system RseC family protein [Deltaproteobacteria bacterium]|nr:SoxR reducing system RseC family protein [Deltaproteobacteria bacterium]